MNEPMNEILQLLKKHGERLDSEIVEATGIKLAAVRLQLSEMAAKGEVIMCSSILFVKDKKVERTIYRIAGYIPSAAPGRKPKVQLKLS